MLLDHPDRFWAKLDDPFLLHWISDIYQHGPRVMQDRLTGLLNPAAIEAIATGPEPTFASNVIHILLDSLILRDQEWITVKWASLDEDVGSQFLRRLTELAPATAERLAIEHVRRAGEEFQDDVRSRACILAIAAGSSDESGPIALELIERYFPGRNVHERRTLLELCFSRDLAGTAPKVISELREAYRKDQLDEIVDQILQGVPGPTSMEFVVQRQLNSGEAPILTDMSPLFIQRANLKVLAAALNPRASTPVDDLLAWHQGVFGESPSLLRSLLLESRTHPDLEEAALPLAATFALSRLLLPAPALAGLSLDRLVRMIGRPVSLTYAAKQFADRLRSFPPDQVVAVLKKYIKPGDTVDPMARFNALGVLRELAYPEAIEHLIAQLSREPDDPAVQDAVSALVALGEPAAELLVARFPELSPDVQIQACRVLVRVGGKAATRLVEEWFSRTDGDLRIELVEFIEFWPDESFLPALEQIPAGQVSAVDEAVVVLDLLFERDDAGAMVRREGLIRDADKYLPTTCPCCGGELVVEGDSAISST